MSPNHKVKEVAEELLWNVVCCTMLYPDDYKMEIYIKLLKSNGLLSETNNRRSRKKALKQFGAAGSLNPDPVGD